MRAATVTRIETSAGLGWRQIEIDGAYIKFDVHLRLWADISSGWQVRDIYLAAIKIKENGVRKWQGIPVADSGRMQPSDVFHSPAGRGRVIFREAQGQALTSVAVARYLILINYPASN